MAKQFWPRVQATVVCDAVEASAQETDVFHLEGVRSQIQAPSFRYVRPRRPLTIVPVVFRFRNCGFPAPGVYYVQVICEGKLIGERPLHLVLGEPGNGQR